jgi:excisionase family DNA binding protein
MIEPTTVDQKARAKTIYQRARRKGELTPPDACEHCGVKRPGLHGHHHNGYADEHALDVVWLCNPCHQRVHAVTPMQQKPIVSPLVTIEEAAAQLQIPIETLRKWRAQGRGPQSMKLGRHVRYDKADLDQWINEQKGNGSWGF